MGRCARVSDVLTELLKEARNPFQPLEVVWKLSIEFAAMPYFDTFNAAQRTRARKLCTQIVANSKGA